MKTHKGHINLSNLYLTELPSFLENIKVDGRFSCYNNKLTSLEYCPKEINGNFYCYYNNLTSLEHCPKVINGNFWCSNNAVEFTEEYVRSLCDVKGNIFV